MMEKSPLATTWILGNVKIPNRIVMAPMTTNLVDDQGHVTQALIKYLTRRAKGGCGMIIVESATVECRRGGAGRTLKMDNDSCIAGCQTLVCQLHKYGVIAVAQLWHAGPRAQLFGDLAFSSSGSISEFPNTRSLDLAEIKDTIQLFIAAGDRAARSGFDAIEIHAAHGYLLHYFVDRETNRRKDRYGGTVQKRFRILAEIRQGLRVVHPELPVILRVSLRPDEDFAAIAASIKAAGFNAVDVRTGFSSQPTTTSGKPVSAAYCLPLARKLRPHLNIPLLVGGRILTYGQAVRAVVRDQVTAILLGRPLLADPDWPKKALKAEQALLCKYDCYPSCYSEFKLGKPLRCVFYERHTQLPTD